jgi:hypothetical protein
MMVKMNGTAKKFGLVVLGLLLTVLGYVAKGVVADVRQNHDRGISNEFRVYGVEKKLDSLDDRIDRLNSNLELVLKIYEENDK